MRDNIKEEFTEMIRLGTSTAMPVLPIALDQFSADYSGITYRDYSTDANSLSQAWIKVIDDFDLDWAGIFIDDLFEIEPLGITTTDETELPKAVLEHLPFSEGVLNNLAIPDPESDGRMPMNIDAIKQLRAHYGEKILISRSVPDPFSAICLTFGLSESLMMLYDNPELIDKSLQFFLKLETIWSDALIRAGVDVIWLGNLCSSSRFLSLDLYDRFIFESNKELIGNLKKSGGIVIAHGCEDSIQHLEAMRKTDADILTIGDHIDIDIPLTRFAGDICLMGNLDPIKLLLEGTPELIQSEISSLKHKIKEKGGLIINTTEGIPKQIPMDNLRVMIESIKKR